MDHKQEIIEQAATVCQCFASDFVGTTLQNVFEHCQEMGATVFWGCWTDEQLNSVIY